VTDSEFVTIVSAESQEAVEIDAHLVELPTWASGQEDHSYQGSGAWRWLSGDEVSMLRQALVPLLAGSDDTARYNSINRAVDLIDYALKTQTGVAVVVPRGPIVSTERLGVPGDESGWLERRGIEQKRLTYPNQPDRPTATCHLQPHERENALCGYQWEGLVPIPGAASLDDVPEEMRCPRCRSAALPAAD
jgi:hypothetical protein